MSLSAEKKKLLNRLRSPRLRAKAGAFLVEGIRGTREFLRPTLPLKPLFALTSPRLLELSGGGALKEDMGASGLQVEEVSDEEFGSYSATENPQGVLLVVREPAPAPEEGMPLSSPTILVLDGIQDPGNVGTLIRGARAFGLGAVVSLDGTADPWGPKAARASAGALAHIPTFRLPWQGAMEWLESLDLPLFAACADGMPVHLARHGGRWALAVGNEGAGVREEVREEAQALVAVPMAPGVDSLNVAAAGAVLLYALAIETSNVGGA